MTMSMSTHLSPLVALIVGILILIFPRFLNYFIAVYLIITGLIGLGALRTIGAIRRCAMVVSNEPRGLGTSSLPLTIVHVLQEVLLAEPRLG